VIRRSVAWLIAVAVLASGLAPRGALAEGRLETLQLNNYGTPGGLIDMPTAEMAPDAQFSLNLSHFEGYTKSTLSFQILPWLTGSFRFIGVDQLSPAFRIYYDRSFDIRAQIWQETEFLPAVAVGLRDFLGTGVLSGEYVVATKQINNRLRLTGGVGWGRLGSYNSFGSLGTRAPFTFAGVGTGGDFNFGNYFQGRMAVFGGASYDLTDKLSFAVEYSSDAYELERSRGILSRPMPWNVAVNYRASDAVTLGAFVLHGSEVGLKVNLSLNPRKPVMDPQEPAPLPVLVRSAEARADLGWTFDTLRQVNTRATLAQFLEQENIVLEGMTLTANSAHLRIVNDTYNAPAQALGRTFRAMSRALPGSVEVFRITVVGKSNGMPYMTTSVRRSDLERLEHAAEHEMLAAAEFSDSLRFADLPDPDPGVYPRFRWSIGPDFRTFTFSVNNPFAIDVRLEARADYDFGRGWLLRSASSVKLFGNLDTVTNTPSNSRMPRVRTTAGQYVSRTGPTIDELTISKYGRLGTNLYGRLTAGILELQYAGVSGEMLWSPVDSRLALGAELNYVALRDPEQSFKLASMTTPSGTIPDVNGHLSAYYLLNNEFDAAVHAGRYLAGDWGATLELARSFSNGWRVGAFATKTDVSAQTFGEGSFDKGIFVSIPYTWLLGTPTQKTGSRIIRLVQRDGGQRVSVNGRLHDLVHKEQRSRVADSWGKFWR
jgi:hypothetical protein